MKSKSIFTLVYFLLTLFSFAQTNEQKQMIYEQINQDSSGKSLVGQKIEPIKNKEALFEKAKLFPVYHVDLDKNEQPILNQNKDSYLIFYEGRLYVFFNDDKYRLFENSPEIKNILELVENKREIRIVYFTNYNYLGETFKILITDKTFSFVLEKNKKYSSLLDYIDNKYVSFQKYKEINLIEKKRKKLTLKDINDARMLGYFWYEKRCPKDTTLIFKKFINQIKSATSGFSKGQEVKLQKRIENKLNPNKYLYDKFYKLYDNDSKIKESTIQRKVENEENVKKNELFKLDYDFLFYKTNITIDLLEILTNKQFQEYKDYIDLFFPIIYDDDNLISNERYTYGVEVFKKEMKININNNYKLKEEYNKYIEKNFNFSDCPFDETIKREVIIR